MVSKMAALLVEMMDEYLVVMLAVTSATKWVEMLGKISVVCSVDNLVDCSESALEDQLEK